MKLITSLLIAALSGSAMADESISIQQPSQKTEQKEITFESPPIRLINYQTREKELILKPDNLTSEEAMKFIPPLPEAPVIFNLYIEEGFSVMDAIQYTHQDILELYKQYVK